MKEKDLFQTKNAPIFLNSTDQSPKRPLDSSAFALIIMGIGLVVLAVLLRLYFNDIAIRQKIESLQSYQGIWVALPKEVVWQPTANSTLQSLSKKELGLKSDDTIASLHFVKDTKNQDLQHMWVRLLSFETAHCVLNTAKQTLSVVQTCQPIHATKNQSNYANTIVFQGFNQVWLLNNFSSNFIRYHANTAERVGSIDNYLVPALPSLSDLQNQSILPTTERSKQVAENLTQALGELDGRKSGKLYRPNQGDVIISQNLPTYVQTDTGNQRILAWEFGVDNQPNLQKPAKTLIKNSQQPYAFAHINHVKPPSEKFVVLESGVVLANANVRLYLPYLSSGQQVRTLDVPLTDPTILTKINDQQLLIADESTGDIVQLDFNDNHIEPTIKIWQNQSFTPLIQAVYDKRQLFVWLTKLAMLLFIAPVLVVFLLYCMGYNLNQKL